MHKDRLLVKAFVVFQAALSIYKYLGDNKACYKLYNIVVNGTIRRLLYNFGLISS